MPLNAPYNKGREGVLFVVATPIGNPDDITLRAIKVLKEVDFIAAEDTRQAKKLLASHGISKPLVSCHEHNEQARTPQFVERMKQGQSMALISDAGTPGLSDPGYRLVCGALDAEITVIPIPGPSAPVAALCASGLPTDAFHFAGFLPRKDGAAKARLEELKSIRATLIFYESPKRLLKSLPVMSLVLGDRRAVLARELTKTHEEFLRGSFNDIMEQLKGRPAVLGECTVLVAGAQPPDPAENEDAFMQALEKGIAQGGLSLSTLAGSVAKRFGRKKAEVYALALKIKEHPAKSPAVDKDPRLP
jgi:16S rRNA (cytidine1402-2'-O)-methyltransferase